MGLVCGLSGFLDPRGLGWWYLQLLQRYILLLYIYVGPICRFWERWVVSHGWSLGAWGECSLDNPVLIV